MKNALILVSLLVGSACASGQSSQKTTVDIRVSNLTESDRITLEKQLSEMPGVENIRSDPFGDRTVFTFEFDGSYDRLKHRISFIKNPGLKPEKQVIQLFYEGFDNTPPTLTVIAPKAEQTLRKTRVKFIVEVVDTDVKSVIVSKSPMKKTKGNLYERTLDLFEGENTVQIVATDAAGNSADQSITVFIETKPPEIQSTVKVVVEGKVEPGSSVFVDGQEASVSRSGNWSIELTVKRGQREVEVVAIDKAGNKKTERKPIGL